jgi:hypothetical protein
MTTTIEAPKHRLSKHIIKVWLIKDHAVIQDVPYPNAAAFFTWYKGRVNDIDIK